MYPFAERLGEPIKIGMMILSLPPEISTIPREAVEAADEMGRRTEDALGSAGFSVTRVPGQVQSEAEALRSTEALAGEKVDCILYMTGSWLHMPIITTPAMRLHKPFIVFAPHHLRISALSTSCIIHGSLEELGIDHKFVYGVPEDERVLGEIRRYAAAAMVANRMNGSCYGLFGGRSMYMYTGMPDLVQVKKIFGVETAHIDEHVVLEKASTESGSRVREFLQGFRARFKHVQVPDGVLDRSARLHLALAESVRENCVDFAGVKCIPEVAGDYASYCLAVSMGIDGGLVTACEADTNGALTMQALKLLSGGPVASADVKELDMDDGRLRLINCGTLPTGMATGDDDIVWMEQYESLVATRPGTGACPSFVCRPGRVTLARLSRISGEFVMQIAGAEAYWVPREGLQGVRERWPQAFLRIDGNPREFLQNCRSNHLHWTYGDYSGELVELCRILGIRPILT